MSGRMTSKALVFGSLLVVLSGFPVAEGTPAAAAEECVHPYPCDVSEIPPGPFDLKVVYERLEVPQDWDDPDGPTIELEGWIGLPDVPDGTRVPVALVSTPYIGACPVVPFGYPGCVPTPEDFEAWWNVPAALEWGVPPIQLVGRGIAAAFFSVRGTGTSGGCLNMFGRQEQRDQAFLVDYLGSQSWSNGRVAMGGVSYPAGTAFEAAVQAPSALKTIVTAGIVSDLYTWDHSPQGAHSVMPGGPFQAQYHTGMSFIPAMGNDRAAEHLPDHGARICPDVVETLSTTTTDQLVDDRNEAFYDERRLIDRFGDVSAAVLLAHGFEDDTTHAFQDAEAWRTLTNAPKRSLVGQWGHNLPVAPGALDRPWADVLLPWLDYWLKGVGPAPEGLGTVDYQDTSSTWRTSSAWPPVEAREEVLFLSGPGLAKEPSGPSRRFLSAPVPANEFAGAEFLEEDNDAWPTAVWPSLCAAGATDPLGLAYVSEPLSEDAVLAGNPFALLRLSSDQPGGIVGVSVLSLDEGFDCTDSTDLDLIAQGSADLRFHAGNFVGLPFPVNEPTPVRVDLWDNAQHLRKGSKLAVVVSYGEAFPASDYGKAGQPYAPNITVHGDGAAFASQVVLPMVEGSFGGEPPTIQYPPRPFAPVP